MGKTALITGASRGIGRATAELLARQGFAVAINYVQSQRAAEELAAALRAQGADAAAFQADVADLGQVEAMISAVEKRLGPVRVLVNNAGIAAQRLFTDITPAEWNAMLGVHVNGAYHCCRCVLPSMIREKRGKIVNVSGGGCPDVPYLAALLTGQCIGEAEEPRVKGQTLCSYSLQRAFEEARRLWRG